MNDDNKRRSRKFPALEIPENDAPVFVTTAVQSTIHRVFGENFETYAQWIAPLIQQAWGNPPMGTVFGWMRMWALSNEYSFVGTQNAAGLAQLVHDPMCPNPRVEEVFLFVRNDATEEGLDIYRHWSKWMATMRADEFRFNHVQGAPISAIKTVFPGLKRREMWYVEAE